MNTTSLLYIWSLKKLKHRRLSVGVEGVIFLADLHTHDALVVSLHLFSLLICSFAFLTSLPPFLS